MLLHWRVKCRHALVAGTYILKGQRKDAMMRSRPGPGGLRCVCEAARAQEARIYMRATKTDASPILAHGRYDAFHGVCRRCSTRLGGLRPRPRPLSLVTPCSGPVRRARACRRPSVRSIMKSCSRQAQGRLQPGSRQEEREAGAGAAGCGLAGHTVHRVCQCGTQPPAT